MVEDGWKNLSVASEVITRVAENGIKLKAPPIRVCWPTSHVPMSAPLEKEYYPNVQAIVKSIKQLI